jgi:hypothetical protein
MMQNERSRCLGRPGEDLLSRCERFLGCGSRCKKMVWLVGKGCEVMNFSGALI